jgi:putative two-component system response regulator
VSSVLVIDDEQIVRDLMVEILQEAGYRAESASTAERGLELLKEDSITVVVSDIVMPGLSGLELLEAVRLSRPSLPIVLVTGAGTFNNLSEAIARGADGLVMKPFSHAELERAVATALDRAGRSERELMERLLTPTLAGALANAIEARDLAMEGHCERLSALAMVLARRLGLDRREVETVRLGAILHDIGKIGIPDRVLLKPGPFTEEELDVMRTHPLIGDRLLEPLDLLDNARPIVRHHHERWDGAGYPDGLAGTEIPLLARLVAVADAIEAMSGKRPYRRPFSRDEVERELEVGRGTQWDPELVDLALAVIREEMISFEHDGVRVEDVAAASTRAVRSVLLVENDLAEAGQATKALESEIDDIRVVHAADLASAEKLWETSVWSAAVLDQELPDGEGLALIGRIRKAAPGIPIVMMTGKGCETAALEAFRQGATDYVVKSDDYIEKLTGRIRILLEAA